MEIPTIQLNLDYFVELGQLPAQLLLWQLFVDGGWILVLWIAVMAAWLTFTARRKAQYASTITYTMLAVHIPKDSEQTPMAMEHVFSQVASVYSKKSWWEEKIGGEFTPGFSFEIVSVNGVIHFYVRTPSKFRDLIEAAIYSQYPDSEIIETTDYADDVSPPDADWNMTGTEFLLKKHWAYPIRTYKQFEDKNSEVAFKDPLSGFFEAMNTLKVGEQIWVQVLVNPCDDDWQEKGAEIISKITGKKVAAKASYAGTMVDATLSWPKAVVEQVSGVEFDAAKPGEVKKEEKKDLTPGDKKVLEAVQEKLAKIGFQCKIRVVYIGRRDVFSKGRMSGVKGALHQFGGLDINQFKALGAVTPKPGGILSPGKERSQQRMLMSSYRKRSAGGGTPYYLNTEELASIYHFPMRDVKAPLLKRTDAKRSQPPTDLPTEDRFESPLIRKNEDEDDGLPPNLPIG
jgi:hypothetical protein